MAKLVVSRWASGGSGLRGVRVLSNGAGSVVGDTNSLALGSLSSAAPCLIRGPATLSQVRRGAGAGVAHLDTVFSAALKALLEKQTGCASQLSCRPLARSQVVRGIRFRNPSRVADECLLACGVRGFEARVRRAWLLPLSSQSRLSDRSLGSGQGAGRMLGEVVASERVEPVARRHPCDEMTPDERLLGDDLRGDSTLFAREDSVEAAWRVLNPILGNVTRSTSTSLSADDHPVRWRRGLPAEQGRTLGAVGSGQGPRPPSRQADGSLR